MMRPIRASVHGLLAGLACAVLALAGLPATARATAASSSLLARSAAPARAVLFRSLLDPARAPLADLAAGGGGAAAAASAADSTVDAAPAVSAATDSADAAPAPAAAPAAAPAPAPRLHAAPMPSLVGPLAGGLLGGAAGLYAGALVGLALNENDSGEWDELGAALTGALLGEILVLPLGVHVGNGRRGSYGADLGISAIGALGGIGLLAITGGSSAGLALGVTFQLAITTAQERSTARRRAARATGDAP